MNKVVFTVSQAGKSQSKVSGVGYIDDKNLYIPRLSKKVMLIFEFLSIALNFR